MRSARLDQALNSGLLCLPTEGRIVVLRPRIGDELTSLPRDRLLVATGFRPDHDWFAARGYATTSRATGDFAAAIVCLPRAKEHAHAMLAEAANLVTAGGPIVIDGQKTDSVNAVLKELRSRVALSESLSKAHGKLATFPAGPKLAVWAAKRKQVDDFITLPGVFSADGADTGSVLLAKALSTDFKGRVGDLGSGWGYLSRKILSFRDVKECHLVEAEADALDCARLNILDNRAQFHWADATTWKSPHALDHIVMNPPFHTKREANPALGANFITAAARNLNPQGVLWLVMNRHLPYDRSLTAMFRDIAEIGGNSSYRLIRAAVPLHAR
ncbi:MAG: class I SAM-dependent methyltransferase [Rhodobacteraceae bacterium]|nr:class I SAM-dependent methyltransferase [Paracoccaceae bacterium]